MAVGVAVFLGLVFVLSRLPRQHGDGPARLSSAGLRRTIAGLQTDAACLLNGRRLALGEHTAWGHGQRAPGGPAQCYLCECTIEAAEGTTLPQCFVQDCPSSVCVPEIEEYEPQHPCCAVCGDWPREPAPHASPTQAIDPKVPFTRDIYNSSFRHVPTGLCRPSVPLVVLAVVSVPRAARRRALFRHLYGAETAAHRIQLIFLLGRDAAVPRAFNDFTDEDFEFVYPEGEEEERLEREATARQDAAHFDAWQRAVDAEAAAFDDIVQSDVAEHYFHLGLKTVSLLDVLRQRCTGLRFVAKTDDDVLVTVRRLAEQAAALGAARAIHGVLRSHGIAARQHDSWYSSEHEWPWPQYPPFVLGPGYLISGDAVEPLFRQALATRYHHLEDVFITGIVAEAVGVQRHDWSGQCSNPLRGANLCRVSQCAFTHRVDYETQGSSFELLLNASRRFDVDGLCSLNATGFW